MIEKYPGLTEISMDMRSVLHPRFQLLSEGISEFTFAGIYLFRHRHNYALSELPGDLLLISGKDDDMSFFMLPFGLPDKDILKVLFERFGIMKTVSETQAKILSQAGCEIIEDRDNFDYLYLREELAKLSGRKFHTRKNLVNRFIKNNKCEIKPLLEEYKDDAIEVLEQWKQQNEEEGDYLAAKEAIENMQILQLCGGIYYINERAVAFNLGEELAQGKWFVIHFEKAVADPSYNGLYQFINQSFVSLLPEKYEMVNREQDLGIPGLRKSKESYNPYGFVKKYKAVL